MLRVLIVEDEALIALVASIALEEAGHHVMEAIDGEEGLKIARQEQPELIITDYMMPRMNGLEMIERLREGGFEGPIVLATAVSEENLPFRPRYDAYLSKPYREKELLAVVQRFLRES
jgi:CheY-like chemotaxis protein